MEASQARRDDRFSARGSAPRAELPEYLPARMLNEYVYCPRLFFYEWVEGLFADSYDTVEGRLRHEKLGEQPQSFPTAEELPEEFRAARAVTLASERHRLIAKIDLVEVSGGAVKPVDYKKGAPRSGANGAEAWEPETIQVCAHAIILRENGYRCEEAVIYYAATKQRVVVPITEELIERTIAAAQEAWRIAQSGRIPPPLDGSPKCPRCSLVGICLPDETTLFRTLRAATESVQLALFPELEEDTLETLSEQPAIEQTRRLVPARDDLRPLYVVGHGLTIGRSGDLLQVRDQGKTIEEIRLREVSQINVFGNVQLTASAVQAALAFERPIAYFSQGGWFYGMTQGIALKNIFLRIRQFAAAGDEAVCLAVARRLVTSKIRNQRTLLQRNNRDVEAQTLHLLRNLAQAARHAPSLDELRGIEGTAGRVYFGAFAGMIKADSENGAFPFDFHGRNRRPPRDPVNALLSFAYALLVKDLTVMAAAVGFEPYLGFYHQPRFGRPALALDLMEEFRPLIADSCVLTAINTGMIKASDFFAAGPAVVMKPSARKNLLRAYEQRMDTLVTHPLFNYRVSYRRVLEIQARLLARYLSGELPHYPGFETR